MDKQEEKQQDDNVIDDITNAITTIILDNDITTPVKCKKCYNKKSLQEVCDRDKCIIDCDKFGKINRETKIDFICICGIEYCKTIRQIYDVSGGYCKICTKNKRKEKVKQTCIERYGVEHHFQSQEAKDKYKQTCIEIYGVENPMQSQEIKDKYKQTCIERYGVENASQSQEVKDKMKATCIERYGVENAFQSQELKDKIKQTCIERFGVEYPSQSQEVKDKKIETCFNNYGVEYPMQSQEVRDKSKQTCIERFGVENPMQSQEVKDKSKQTCIERFGVEHPMQNAEFAEKTFKNAYNLKAFNFLCGTTIFVQGYEPFLLKNIIEEGYTYDDIITKRTDVPVIWYEKNNKQHRYYCDVYIPKINTIYEVKSTWTFEKDIEDIYFKKQACIDAGYLFLLFVYDSKGIKQDV